MKLLRSLNLVLVSVLLAPVIVRAAPPPEPKVDYSADSTMEVEEMTMKSRIYYTPGKQRMEMGGADGSVTIIRRDKKVMWNLMGDMYMEMPLDQSQDPQDMDVQMTTVGEETVNGIKTTKSKVIATKKDGSKFGGFFWTTKDHITVKMDLLSKDGNEKMRMTQELTNLKIGKQDPKLFEIPPGYTKNDIGAMMGGMGGGGGKGKGKGKGSQPSIQDMMKEAGKDEGGDVDVGKMLKGIMGQ
jgi:hypothetical protein